jgi:hypothetical protein
MDAGVHSFVSGPSQSELAGGSTKVGEWNIVVWAGPTYRLPSSASAEGI